MLAYDERHHSPGGRRLRRCSAVAERDSAGCVRPKAERTACCRLMSSVAPIIASISLWRNATPSVRFRRSEPLSILFKRPAGVAIRYRRSTAVVCTDRMHPTIVAASSFDRHCVTFAEKHIILSSLLVHPLLVALHCTCVINRSALLPCLIRACQL